MHGLARIAMNGRYRALLLAVACFATVLGAWLGAAIVALVTLRKGVQEGVWVLLWAGLPVLVLAKVSGDGSVLALLLGTSILAIVLRSTVNLSLAALAATAVALLTGIGLVLFAQELLVELAKVFAGFIASLEQQTAGQEPAAMRLLPPTETQLAGMLGTANGAMSFLCLALARYWQAALYNPGGFGKEFRALRLPQPVVFVLLAASLGAASVGPEYRSWGTAALVPLTVAGFALLHARVHLRRSGSFGLSLLYATWLVFDAVKLVLVGFAVADAVLDFRRRWGQNDPTAVGQNQSDAEHSEYRNELEDTDDSHHAVGGGAEDTERSLGGIDGNESGGNGSETEDGRLREKNEKSDQRLNASPSENERSPDDGNDDLRDR
ncbi:MAG: hypothetical protein AAF662_11645 [Pseudomonadota bacterium]